MCVWDIHTDIHMYKYIYLYIYVLRIFQAKFLTDFPAQTSWTSALVSCASAFRFVSVFPAVAHSLSLSLSPALAHKNTKFML